MYTRSLVLSLLASSALAAPALVLREDDCTYDDCPSYNMTDVHEMCNWNLDDNDMSIAQNLWWQTAAGYQLDSFIKAYGSNDWPREMFMKVFGPGSQPNLDCSTASSTCSLDKTCQDFMKADPHIGGPYYWALFAAVRAHDAFNYMYEETLADTVIQSLSVDDIISDMGAGMTQPNPFAMIGGAFGMASALTAPVPGLSPALGFIGGAFGMAAQFYQAPDPTGDITAAIRDFYQNAKDSIDKTLFDAMGTTASDGTEPDPDALQSQTEDYYNDTPIGRFFADGKFLIENAGPALGPAMDAGLARWRGGLAVRVLGEAPLGYHLWARGISEEDCNNADGDDVGSWLFQDGYCFGLYSTYSQPTIGGGYWALNMLGNDKVDKLTGDYGVDLSEVYRNAWDCHVNHGDGDVDPTALPYDGTLPACFYKMDVVEGDFDSSYGGWD